jgi:hypothetical protein
MIPPSSVFIRRRWQLIIQNFLDLLKAERNLFLDRRQIAQVLFERSIFSSHLILFLQLAFAKHPVRVERLIENNRQQRGQLLPARGL